MQNFINWNTTQKGVATISTLTRGKDKTSKRKCSAVANVHNIVEMLIRYGEALKDVKEYAEYKINNLDKKVVNPSETAIITAVKLEWIEVVKAVQKSEQGKW